MNPGTMPVMAMGLLTSIKAHLTAIVLSLLAMPGEWPTVGPALARELFSADGLRTFAYGLVVLMVASALEWLYWSACTPVLKAIEATEDAKPRRVVVLALRRLGLKLCGLVLFVIGLLAATATLAWPAGAPEVVVALAFILLILRLAWILIDTLVAPALPRLRPLPLGARAAYEIAGGVMGLALLGVSALFLPVLVAEALQAPALASVLRLALATLIALGLVLAAVFLAGGGRPPAGGRRGWLPHIPRAVPAVALILAVYVLWLFGFGELALLFATFTLVVGAQAGLRTAVFALWRDDIAAAAADPSRPDPTLMPSLVLPVARLLVVLAGLAIAIAALDVPLTGMAMSDDPLARLGLHVFGVLALGLLTNAAWIAVRTTIDYRLKAIGPVEPHQGTPSPNARLLTLLPLLRLTTGVVLLVLFVLSGLWTLGIEITPLLAGAGVIGIAVGFGAQALVRDIIAGIFYLAEDVFRVGEYIESGPSTKGTVERITLRTVALRHHNGPLHFVPYGALGTVRNTSRDWVIDKFNLPLPVSVDSEAVRKLVKKIGQAMHDDPEFAHLLREPLKAKLYRVEPGIKVFRCKFETTPGLQFELRSEAYKRIEAALKAAGISFADFPRSPWSPSEATGGSDRR